MTFNFCCNFVTKIKEDAMMKTIDLKNDKILAYSSDIAGVN